MNASTGASIGATTAGALMSQPKSAFDFGIACQIAITRRTVSTSATIAVNTVTTSTTRTIAIIFSIFAHSCESCC